jgi:hypothetical protein
MTADGCFMRFDFDSIADCRLWARWNEVGKPYPIRERSPVTISLDPAFPNGKWRRTS